MIVPLALIALAVCHVHGAGLKNLIKFEFISDNYVTQHYTINNLEHILNNPKFDRNKPTAIYSYGFTQTVNQPSVREIVDAYLSNGQFNLIVVNYSSILAYTLFSAVEFGDNIASSLIKLFDAGYSNFHVIGFSLGGQISGVIGRSVIKQSRQKYIIPRITGLDPGQIPPPFLRIVPNLNAGDALFVDTIHGETKFFGSKDSLGHASFWVNGGILQPTCSASFFLITSICSHLTTPKFWAESVRNRNTQMFRAQQCNSYEDFKSLRCGGSTGLMGLNADRRLRGRFYLDLKLDQ